MKEIHDIFSKKKETKEIDRVEIVIDIHEKNCLVPSFLSSLKIPFKFESLQVGDYILNDLVIERKTFNDFLSSILDKRLFTQLKNLNSFSKRFLLIEGFDFEYSKKSIHGNAIRGAILSINLDYQTPIVFSKDCKETAIYLELLSRKERYEKSFSIRPGKKIKPLEEIKQFILEGFPGIGPSISKKLIEKYKTLENIFRLEEGELSKIPKLDYKKFKEILSS